MLHERVKKERKKRRMTLDDLAKVAGVSRSQLLAFEHGGNPTLSTIEKTLAPLGLRLGVFSDELDPEAALSAGQEIQKRTATLQAAIELFVAEIQKQMPAIGYAAGRLVSAFGGNPATARPPVAPPGPLPGGGERGLQEVPLSQEVLDRIEDIVTRIIERETKRRDV